MWTNAYGATSSSTTTTARGSRRRFRPLTESPQVVNTRSSPSSRNHTGITCGRPPGPLVASLAVRVPWLRKPRTSSGVIARGIERRLPDRRPQRTPAQQRARSVLDAEALVQMPFRIGDERERQRDLVLGELRNGGVEDDDLSDAVSADLVIAADDRA